MCSTICLCKNSNTETFVNSEQDDGAHVKLEQLASI